MLLPGAALADGDALEGELTQAAGFGTLPPAVPYSGKSLGISPGHPQKRLSERSATGLAARLASLGRAEAEAAAGTLKPSPLEVAQTERRKELLAQLRHATCEGVGFQPGLVAVSPEGRERVHIIAEVLRRYPEAIVKVVGYSAKPSGLWPTQDDCEMLTLQRAKLTRSLLLEAGCTCDMVAQGAGYVDEKGPRCEVWPCSRSDAYELRLKAGLLREPELRVAFTASESEFAAPVAEADPRLVVFRRAPLGMTFSQTMPSEVLTVDPGGHAEEVGVQVGWRFYTVDGESLEDMDFRGLMRHLEAGVAKLPRTAV